MSKDDNEKNEKKQSNVISLEDKAKAKAKAKRVKRHWQPDDLNKNHAVVPLGNKTAIMHETRDPGTGRIHINFQKETDFRLLHSNKRVPMQNNRTTDLGSVWLKSENRRQYSGVEFNPSGDTPGKFNLFRGFPIEPKQGSDHIQFKNFVREVICTGEDRIFYFVWRWLAHLFQKPGQLPDTGLVMRSVPGCGKNFFVKALSELIGLQHFIQLTSTNQLTGRFNKHLSDLLLVHANESLFGGDRSGIGNLNAMVTDQESFCEAKGFDGVPVDNYKRLVISSNESWPLPMALDDRRFLVLDVSDEHRKDFEYFEEMQESLDNGGHANLMHEFLNLDIQNFNVRNLPQTNAGFDIKLRSASTVVQWWHEILTDGNLLNAWESAPISFPKSDLHNLYLEFCKKHGGRWPCIPDIFSKELKKMCSYGEERRTEAGQRVRKYKLPSLVECRKAFESKANLSGYNWS